MSIIKRHRHRWTKWTTPFVAAPFSFEKVQTRRCVVCDMVQERKIRVRA